jgi:chromosome segregation ATPase
MNSTPNDSVFDTVHDSPGPRPGASIPGAAHHTPGADRQAGTDAQWANAELMSIAGTIAELQERLAEANARAENATQVETSEVEIGRLFVEAQRFSEVSLTKLETQIHEILREVEAKAIQILSEATAEALEIRRRAQQAAFASTATARELQEAIVGFTKVNDELVKELGSLNNMLTPATEKPASEVERSTGGPENA